MDILLNTLEKEIPPLAQNPQPTKKRVPISVTLEVVSKEQFNFEILRIKKKWLAQHLAAEEKWKVKLENNRHQL